MIHLLRTPRVVLVTLACASCGSNSPIAGPAAPIDVSGEYTVTLTADSACPDLPNEARSRTYTASIVPERVLTDPARTRYRVTVQGGSLVWNANTFDADVTGDILALRFLTYPPDWNSVMEQIAPNSYLAFRGTATATVTPAPSVISAAFDGPIDYCALKSLGVSDIEACGSGDSWLDPTPSQPVTYTRCESKNHQMVFTRR